MGKHYYYLCVVFFCYIISRYIPINQLIQYIVVSRIKIKHNIHCKNKQCKEFINQSFLLYPLLEELGC